MTPPPPAKDKPEKVPAARREPPRKPLAQDYDLRLRFYTTMRPQRVYPLAVEVPGAAPGRAAEAPTGVLVLIRPVISGAVVVPATQPLDVSRPGARVTFDVTPVARGRLPGARVEVLRDGRPVQELRLRMRATTQRMTWIFLLLTVLLPILLMYFTRYGGRMSGNIIDQRKRAVPGANAPADNPGRAAPRPQRGGAQPQAPVRPGEVFFMPEGPAEGQETPRGGAEGEKPRGGGPRRGGRDGGDKPADKPAEGGQRQGGGPVPPPVPTLPEMEYYERPGMPGEVMEFRVRTALEENVPDVPDVTRPAVNNVAKYAGLGYGFLCDWAQDMHTGFWLAVALLIVTFASWLGHRTGRARITRSLSLPVMPAATTSSLRPVASAETLPLAQAAKGRPEPVEPE
jgi:hypothetical protein